jgi:hypothetical protein
MVFRRTKMPNSSLVHGMALKCHTGIRAALPNNSEISQHFFGQMEDFLGNRKSSKIARSCTRQCRTLKIAESWPNFRQ